jgi:hypothetical protein
MDSDHRNQRDPERRNRRRLVRDDHVEATAFIHEIVMTADSLREARAFDGESAMHFEPRWRLLRAVERCGGAPTFTDLNGLEPAPMRTTRHVLRVIRLRLERYENNLRAAKRSLVSAASARR